MADLESPEAFAERWFGSQDDWCGSCEQCRKPIEELKQRDAAVAAAAREAAIREELLSYAIGMSKEQAALLGTFDWSDNQFHAGQLMGAKSMANEFATYLESLLPPTTAPKDGNDG